MSDIVYSEPEQENADPLDEFIAGLSRENRDMASHNLSEIIKRMDDLASIAKSLNVQE